MSEMIRQEGTPIYVARVDENKNSQPALVAYSEDLEHVARALTRGVIFQLGAWWFIGLGLLAVIAIIATALWGHPDATDASKWNRSGVKLRTDHGTGCQYLESTAGALTPRLDAAGRPVCGVRP